MKIPAPNYAETIDLLVARFLLNDKNDDIESLVAALGCSYSDSDSASLHVPNQPDPSNEYLVQATLLQAIRWHSTVDGYISDGIALLEGLIRNDRWRQCLKNTNDAVVLSALLMDFAVGEKYAGKLHALVSPGVCGILNSWLLPPSPIEAPLSPTELARALFGDAWYDISIGHCSDELTVGRFVLSSKPPFRPGLLADHLNDHVQQLPDLGAL